MSNHIQKNNASTDTCTSQLFPELGKEVSNVRKLLDLTQAEFADAIGITVQTLSLLENGKFKITNNLAAKLYFSFLEILNDCELDDLICLTDIQKLAIKLLISKLHNYIATINSNLKTHLRNDTKNQNPNRNTE